ncbi:putative membrane protein [Helicobacter pylori SouthAfrica20]|uniref:Putative membrane protein n=1 Tax=Helicobacter pylori SouthAfrica20 TaxID=1352356 RepID=T1UBH0_HELPX|nr:putative membrane protein [Helicobacter pylori SouthAfrica20]
MFEDFYSAFLLSSLFSAVSLGYSSMGFSFNLHYVYTF